MKSHTRYLTMKVPTRMDLVNITGEVEAEVRASGVQEGLCLVNAMHITASVFINDDAGPRTRGHNRTGEDACPGRRDRGLLQASLADAHPKRNATRMSCAYVA